MTFRAQQIPAEEEVAAEDITAQVKHCDWPRPITRKTADFTSKDSEAPAPS